MREDRYLALCLCALGASTMAAEVTLPRLLAPSFGATQIVWTNAITVVLLALALGAWVGGFLAERAPRMQPFAKAMALAGVLLAAVPMAARPILSTAHAAVLRGDVGAAVATFAATLSLVAPPIALVGALFPWALRIRATSQAPIGRAAGVLSASQVAGSVAGTLAATYAGIPLLGVRFTFVTAGCLLLLLALPRLPIAWTVVASLCIASVTLGSEVRTRASERILWSAESPYQRVEVTEDMRGTKRLYLNEGIGVQSLLPIGQGPVPGVWEAMAQSPSLVAGDGLRVLVAGLAGGTVPRRMVEIYGPSRFRSIDGVEIDPQVLHAGRRFFGLDEIPRLSVHEEDARLFLARSGVAYDVIVVDAYRGYTIPPHLVTREFFQLCRNRLARNGVVVLNLAVPPHAVDLLDAVTKTVASVFGSAWSREIDDAPSEFFRNYLIVSGTINRDLYPLPDDTVVRSQAPSSALVLTDDRAPVEALLERALLLGPRRANTQSPLDRHSERVE